VLQLPQTRITGGLTSSGCNRSDSNDASAAGSNTITVAAGTSTASANKLAYHGGLTIANNIVINAACFAALLCQGWRFRPLDRPGDSHTVQLQSTVG
jgi:hypothetical protein